MTEATDITKTEQKELAELYAETGLEERAGEAQEGLTQDDFAMPFIALLQPSSPQCSKADARYIKGAEEGMFFNTVENNFYGDEITIVPCAYRRSFVEWIVREQGGGYVGEYLPGTEPKTVEDDKKRDIIKENGHELKETAYWYVLVLHKDGSYDPAVIGMSRTQMRPSKRLQYLVAKPIWPDGKERASVPPSYAWTYTARSTPQQKDDNSFWNWEFSRSEGVKSKAIIEAAIALHDSVKSGQVKEATDSLAEAEGSESANARSDSY